MVWTGLQGPQSDLIPKTEEVLLRTERRLPSRPCAIRMISNSEFEEAGKYWESYYSSQPVAPPVPSQFAAFIAGESGDKRHIVDIGCGNGRDTFFFSRVGLRVIGVDGSSAAIKICQAAAQNDNPTFLCSPIENPELADKIERVKSGNAVVYARFFLHAVSETAQLAFLNLALRLCKPQGFVAVEFRTRRDEAQQKITKTHYRRFIDPIGFLNQASEVGLRPQYFVEGFGYAKFRADDAHVARCILSPK
jgi:SAM-dependent methyltransferase